MEKQMRVLAVALWNAIQKTNTALGQFEKLRRHFGVQLYELANKLPYSTLTTQISFAFNLEVENH